MAFGNATKGYVKKHSGSGGGGGTTNYSELTNKPSINGVTLDGNKTSEDLGIIGGGDGYGFSDLTLVKNVVSQFENIVIDINNIKGIVFVKVDGSSRDFYIVPKELMQLVTPDAHHKFRHDFLTNNYIEVTPWVDGSSYKLEFNTINFSEGLSLSLYTY